MRVITESEEYGLDEFGPYDSLTEAYEAIARLAAKAAELNDGIQRSYTVTDSN